MNVTITDQERCRKQVRLEIPSETVRTETNKLASNLARKVNVPGFRRGHVPTSVVKTRFRKELRDEVVSNLLPRTLADIIRDKELHVVGEPSLEDFKFNDDDSINATFILEVVPTFELGNYRGMPLRKRTYRIRDEEINSALAKLRDSHAELVPVEDREAQGGDLVTANLKGHLEPEESDGAQEQGADEPELNKDDAEIEIGGRIVLKEFSEALTGTRVGDTRTFTVEYPEDYKPDRLAGRRATVTAEVTAVRFKELPDLNDEFATSVSEEFKSIEDLKADIRSKYERQASQRSESELRAAAMDQLVDRHRFELPDYVVEKHMDSRIDLLARNLLSQGIDPRRLNVDWEAIREGQRERAEREARGSFILSRIAGAEKIEAEEGDVDQEIETIGSLSGQTPEATRARLTRENMLDNIRGQIRNRKALDLVIASAEIRIEEVEGLGAGEESTGAEEGGRAGG